MGAVLRVKKWDEFQHYKERNPPWIKLHKGYLDNYEFQCLPVDSRALAPMIWLLASESKDGSIEYNLEKIGFRIRMSALELEAALVPLISGGFLELEGVAIAPLAERKQDAMPETEAERETEAEEETDSAPSAARVVKRETSNTRKKGTRLAIDAEPDAEDIRYAREEYGWPVERIALEWANMRDWSQSSRNGAKLDWRATWRTWVRRCEAEHPTKPTRVADRRASIVAGLGAELSGEADIVGGIGRNAEPDGDGAGEPAGIYAHLGGNDHSGERESVRGGDGSIIFMGGNVRTVTGRSIGDGAVSRDVGGPAGGPVIDGDRTDDPGAPVPQSPEASGHSETDRGGFGAAPVDAERSPIIPEGDPLDIPPFLRRSA